VIGGKTLVAVLNADFDQIANITIDNIQIKSLDWSPVDSNTILMGSTGTTPFFGILKVNGSLI